MMRFARSRHGAFAMGIASQFLSVYALRVGGVWCGLIVSIATLLCANHLFYRFDRELRALYLVLEESAAMLRQSNQQPKGDPK
jgi:hypothetical protein